MSIRILTIDDNPADHLIFKYAATEFATIEDVSYCNTGEDALKFLNNLSPHSFPHFIFVDIYLNNASGLEFLKSYMRANYTVQYPDTQLIILSGKDLARNQQIASRLACVSQCIQKPFTVEKLKALCESKAKAKTHSLG